MAVPFRFIFIPRLVTVCTFSTKHNRHRDILVKLTRSERGSRTFSTAFVRCNDGEGDGSDSPRLSSKLTSRQALLSRRRRALSPLERISSLLPQDALSPEVMQLREQNQQEQGEDANIRVSVPHCTQQESGADAVTKDEDLNAQNGTEEPQTSSIHHEGGREWPTLPGESLITFGELLIAEYHKRRRVEFKKMFQLQTGAHLQSSWGIILHDDVAGQPAGHFLKTNRGVPIFIRRASLEDYVLHMKRGPVITYPKVERYSCHADDDGRHTGRLCAGVGLRLRSHVSVLVQSSGIYGRRAERGGQEGSPQEGSVELRALEGVVESATGAGVARQRALSQHRPLRSLLAPRWTGISRGGSGHDQPSAGFTHPAPTPAPRGRVCRLPRQHNAGH
ncbi:tRNA (adenine(58)-N(1))-methyltransferase, mitochondrial isoform X2 [Leuresthes tenuis]|uniref:tRNA (adenine(58)-N(1))-methyltransferase, mitochondrial isoform X2 n=1 Tax=Leuresthes tenuis TaxID=355514 RepID=UPI003B505C7A